ncbi:hypothetical protein [Pinirhizobacter soli]|uniref:hypothetical protein n=1 Tax=Pinirhizobacter soli TaxID=2786953 RepID=UPI00202A09EB|nr:hypothetical protein [Pinirhizobacter soli]
MDSAPVALVAEGDRVLAETLADSLEVMGFDPVVVRNEGAAKRVLDEIGEPDLLVCDAVFGKGRQPFVFARKEALQAPRLPVVVTTTPEAPTPADLRGRVSTAEKPFGKVDLQEGVIGARKKAGPNHT